MTRLLLKSLHPQYHHLDYPIPITLLLSVVDFFVFVLHVGLELLGC